MIVTTHCTNHQFLTQIPRRFACKSCRFSLFAQKNLLLTAPPLVFAAPSLRLLLRGQYGQTDAGYFHFSKQNFKGLSPGWYSLSGGGASDRKGWRKVCCFSCVHQYILNNFVSLCLIHLTLSITDKNCVYSCISENYNCMIGLLNELLMIRIIYILDSSCQHKDVHEVPFMMKKKKKEKRSTE